MKESRSEKSKGRQGFWVLAAAFVLGIIPLTALGQGKGHFQEVNGTAVIEAEDFEEAGGGAYASKTPPTGFPAALSNGGLYWGCESRFGAWARYKVTFTKAGTYNVWFLGVGGTWTSEYMKSVATLKEKRNYNFNYAANNFGVFLGTEPNTLRKLNGSQNCSYNKKSSCPNYEAHLSTSATEATWSNSQQCLKSRGCEGNKTQWVIKTPGTYLMAVRAGDEPFFDHHENPGNHCKLAGDKDPVPKPTIQIDKILITASNTKPSGKGPNATYAGSTPIPQPEEPGESTGPTSKPDKVSGLSTAEVGTSSIKLKWNASSHAQTYDIYWTNVTTPDATTEKPEYTISGLTPNREYDIWVKAVNSVGDASGTNLKVTTKPDGSTTGIHGPVAKAFASASGSIGFGAAMAGQPVRILNLEGSVMLHTTLDESGSLSLSGSMESGLYFVSLEGQKPFRVFYGN